MLLTAISGLRRCEAGMNSGHDLYRRDGFFASPRKIKSPEGRQNTLITIIFTFFPAIF